MSVQYFVTAVSTCERCNGAGYVQNAQWQKFFEKRGAEYSGADIDAGCNMLCEFFGVTSVRYLPAEEHACPDCDGAGKITRPVSLAEALREVQP